MKAYAKCVEPDCGLIVYSFDEYKQHRVETGHHLDQSYQDSLNEKPWKGICSKRCWFARKRPCKCKCRRANHQRGLQAKLDPVLEIIRLPEPYPELPMIEIVRGDQ